MHVLTLGSWPAVLLNPFSVFGNPRCNYNGHTGVCYGEVECLALAGQYGNFCSGLHGLCCLCEPQGGGVAGRVNGIVGGFLGDSGDGDV